MAKILNSEIKARCGDPLSVRTTLVMYGAEYKGLDHQIDTYFVVPKGRLKLREGTIENALIYYERGDESGPKKSDITLHRFKPEQGLKQVLERACGVRVVVDKKRHIYFIGNVKFHVDDVVGLGSFVEIEAIDETGNFGLERLQEQCEQYVRLLRINPRDFIAQSYSDLLLEKQS